MRAQTQPEIKSLTGLRGIAALYVMLYHFKIHNFTPHATDQFFRHGYLAVDLFFILSGFVIALTYKSMFENGIAFSAFRAFIGRRIARIYPLYIVMTGLFMAFYDTFYHKVPYDADFSAQTILSNILMVQAWGVGPSIIDAGWSISTEFGAYLLFPIFSILILYRSKWVAHALACVAYLIITILYFLSIGSEYEIKNLQSLNIWDGSTFGPIIRCLAEFSLGIWAYRLYICPSMTEKKYLDVLQKSWGSITATIVILALLALPYSDVAVVILMPFLIVSLAPDKSVLAQFLGWKPIYFIGQISYSLYLCHLMAFWVKPEITNILTAINFPAPHFLTILIQIGMSLLFAAGLFYGVERPSRQIFQKLSWSRNDKSTDRTAPP